MENVLLQYSQKLPSLSLMRLMRLMYNSGKPFPVSFKTQRVCRNERSFLRIVQEARIAGWLEERAEYLDGVFQKYTKLTGKGEIIASAFLEYGRKNDGR